MFPAGTDASDPARPQWRREPEEGFGLLLSISTAPRTDVLGPSLGLLPAALGPKRLPHRQPAPGGRARAPRGRRGPSGAVRPLGRPLGRRRAGRNSSELVGSAERANLEGPACVRPAGSQRAPRPRASPGAMGPPSLGWTPPRALCPPRKARHPLTSGDGVGPAWPEPRRSSCPCAFPGAPRIAGAQHLLLGGLQARQRGFRGVASHTGPLCPCVPRRPGGWPRTSRTARLEGISWTVERPQGFRNASRFWYRRQSAGPGPPAYLSCDLRLPRWASFLLLKLLVTSSYPGQRGEAGVSCWTPDSPTASLHSLGSITTHPGLSVLICEMGQNEASL